MPKLAKSGRSLYSYQKERLLYIVNTKRSIITKLSLFFVAVSAFATIASIQSFTSPTYVYADTTPPRTYQCEGDATKCPCPTTGTEEERKYCTDPVFQNCGVNPNTNSYKKCTADNNLFKFYVNPFIAALSFIVGLAVVIGIIVGGIQYASSAGDPKQMAEGKRHIWSAILALLVYLFLFAMLNFLIPGGL